MSRAKELFAEGFLPFLIVPTGERYVAILPDRSGFLDDEFPYLRSMDGGIETLKAVVFEDSLGIGAQLEADMQHLVDTYRCEWLQTGKNVAHRDLCFFFGVENASRFYYVHIAKTADPHANNIFRVADKPRIAIAERTNDGNDWGSKPWHKIRIERELASGAIRVYFDDMDKPIMTGVDKTFGWGMIGVGSFDDSGRFRKIKVTGDERKTDKRVFR